MSSAEDGSPPRRLSKNQRRLNTILQKIPGAREQLLVAIEEFPPDFDLDALVAAAQSPDARERNKVSVIEREYEVLLNWLNELAARALAPRKTPCARSPIAPPVPSGYRWSTT